MSGRCAFGVKAQRPNESAHGKALAILGTIGLVCAIEFLVARSGVMQTHGDRVMLSWRATANDARGLGAAAEVLFFGDSLVKVGLLPRVFEHRAGLSAYNLAILGGQAPSSFFLLRRVLDGGHRPSAVVVDFWPPLLAMPVGLGTDCWATMASPREAASLCAHARDPVLAAEIAARWLWPSLGRRGAIRSALLSEFTAGQRAGSVDDPRAFERNWRINRGAQVAPRGFVEIEWASAESRGEEHWQWQPEVTSAGYVDRFLGLAAEHHVAVFWVLPPVVASHRDRLRANGLDDAFRQFVAKRVERYPGLTVLDGSEVRWGRGLFHDPLHLNRDGAVRLTLAVTEAIVRPARNDGPKPRWISLADPPGLFPERYARLLEDLNESRSALERGRTSAKLTEASR